MKEFHIESRSYRLSLEYTDQSLWIKEGCFGGISLVKEALFCANIKNIYSGECRCISSDALWKKVSVIHYKHSVVLCFSDPTDISDITLTIRGLYDETGISWYSSVCNDNCEWSVISVTYPMLKMRSEKFELFVPDGSGIVIKDAATRGYESKHRYPGGVIVMQYFAVYNEGGGIYIGIEDGRGSTKEFSVTASDHCVSIESAFYGINSASAANSFNLSGCCRWQYIGGDWYDASMIYANFVKKSADWLPQIESDGRADTPQRFKDVPFWVSDYIPNSASQGDNKPMKLSAGSDLYRKDYWVDAVIELQKKLDVPIAYHVYNWHQIPFNIEYPHFLPAKDEFIERAKKLRKQPIYVLPYINAGSWEMHDAEMGHEINFENAGKLGAIKNANGDFVIEHYPQKTLRGEGSLLANMCPASKEWHTVIGSLVSEMEDTLPIDGIYFDQIGAIQASPCYNTEHGHIAGGGNHWAEGYCLMMEKINAKKAEGSFYFTENNSENYMKSFDGFLTWMWVNNAQVPAFSAVYAGYIELLGRCYLGTKKDDYEFFKFSMAESLLYGQQLGWCKADVVYDEKRMAFLKKAVDLRYRYTELFHSSDMLRPPKVNSPLPPKTTSPALNYRDDIIMEQISAGAWRYKNREKLVIFSYNISECEATFSMTFSAKEYGLDEYELPDDFIIQGELCRVCTTIGAEGFKVWELQKK